MANTPANGWIKLHRKIVDWEWFDDANTFRVFTYLLLTANTEDKKWRGITVKRGQLITSQQKMAEVLSGKYSKTSIQQIRTALDKLKLTGEITVQTNNHFSLVTINNYIEYQEDNRQKTNKQRTTQQTDNSPITTTKEYKEYKEERIEITPEQIQSLSVQLGISSEGIMNWYQTIKDYEASTGKKYKDYSATIRMWVNRAKERSSK